MPTEISAIRQMIRVEVNQVRNLAVDLLQEDLSYLKSRDSIHFADDLTLITDDLCFADLKRNHLSRDHERVLRNLQRSDKLTRLVLKDSGGLTLNPTKIAAYGERVGSLLHRVAANVVPCTFATVGEAALFRSFRPVLIVCEESPCAILANTAILLGNYPKIPLILIEDEAQLRPVIKSAKENGFVKQLAMPLFE